MNKVSSKGKEIAGYVLGGVMFVVLLPTIVWLASCMPALEHIGALRASITGVLIISGLTLSVWSIVYMKHRGKGNPMLTGTLIYLLGFVVWLWTWQALLVWCIFVAIMFFQVLTEEKRLLRDFGDEYEAYCRHTGRFLPFALF